MYCRPGGKGLPTEAGYKTRSFSTCAIIAILVGCFLVLVWEIVKYRTSDAYESQKKQESTVEYKLNY